MGWQLTQQMDGFSIHPGTEGIFDETATKCNPFETYTYSNN